MLPPSACLALGNHSGSPLPLARRRRVAATWIPLLTCLLLGGCGGDTGPAGPPAAATAPSAPQEAVTRIGDVTIRASVVQTSTLPDTVAMQYGIERSDRLALLLVAVRQGPEAQETALPATITATATDLRGRRQDIPMRELRTGDLLDYVGTAEIDLPDTMRFELTIVREGGARSTMQFNREFYPR
ncbi:hypothetical protein N800_01160 [Lysobacter daejeonensis GH1-9]|uniref:DUF4426 domain-containing protein n=1 Tax=Lysobacter daejeonensis GH1-9 TaxID=1385517 RepID=A0A0A0EZH8_9GAMM|nr:hypothetical protein N800_01160 [Lysobacter daejeonensis GH1-9]